MNNNNIFNLNTTTTTKDNIYDDKTSDKEFDVLKGISIDKKNC